MSHSFLQVAPSLAAAAKYGWPFHLRFSVQPILALVAGLLILVRPRFLNFIVAIYLIVVGVLGVLNLHW